MTERAKPIFALKRYREVGDRMVILFSYPARACAAMGKVIEFVFLSVFLSKEILTWRELATSKTSECIEGLKTLLSYLSVPATGLTCFHSLGFS